MATAKKKTATREKVVTAKAGAKKGGTLATKIIALMTGEIDGFEKVWVKVDDSHRTVILGKINRAGRMMYAKEPAI